MKLVKEDQQKRNTLSTKQSCELSDKSIDPVLCEHCLRTLSNGIRCMGICVADNDY